MPSAPSATAAAASVRPVRRHWSSVQQNIKYELYSAHADLAMLADRVKLLDEGEVKNKFESVLAKCGDLVEKASEAQRGWLTQEVLIYQLLLEARQKMLLIMPKEELAAKWIAIRQRLKRTYKDGDVNWAEDKVQKPIDEYFCPPASAKAGDGSTQSPCLDDAGVRYRLKEMKSFLDGKLIDEAWRASSIRRQSYWLSVAIMALVSLIVLLIGYEVGFSPGEDTTAHLPASHNIVGCIIAGAIGGCLSTLASLIAPDAQSSGPPLASVTFARPVVGVISAVVLWLVSLVSGASGGSVTTSFHVGYPLLYVAAIALGFSERLFLSSLGKVAARAESAISSATGQTNSKS